MKAFLRLLLAIALALAPTACARPRAAPVRVPPLSSESTVTPEQTRSPEPTRAPVPSHMPRRRPLVPVFVYHFVKPGSANYIAIPPEMFESHLKELKRLGYTPITAEELRLAMFDGGALPERPVLLTLDDGTEDQYEYAVPLLRKYGFTATFFVYPAALGQRSFMTLAQLRELARLGFDVEPHTWNHRSIAQRRGESLPAFERRVEGELTRPIAFLNENVAKRKRGSLAYPYGYYTGAGAKGQTALALRRQGYQLGFTVDAGVNEVPADDPFMLKRFTVFRADSLADFTARLTSHPLDVSETITGPGSRVPGSPPGAGPVLVAAVVATDAATGEFAYEIDNKRVKTITEVAAPISVSASSGPPYPATGGRIVVHTFPRLTKGFHYVTLIKEDPTSRGYASWGFWVD